MSAVIWMVFLVMAGTRFCDAQPRLPDDMHAWALEAIDLIYHERFKDAEEEARKTIKKYPSHPAGYFFMAAAIDAWMSTHYSDARETEFYRFCELAVEKGEKLLDKNENDLWVRFFIGGAEGYKGTYEARFQRWITAFRYGWKGVSILMKLKDQNAAIVDLNYGIGSYEYWRSAMTKNLRWMPGVDDKRGKGIEKLKLAASQGVYTRLAAATGLIDIYLNEKAFEPALKLADEAIKKYPESRWFLIGKARAELGSGDCTAAGKTIRTMLARMEKDPGNEHAAIAVCHYWLSHIEFAAGRFAECIAECDLMKNYQFDDDSKKLLQGYFEEVESLKKQAFAKRKSNRESGIVSNNAASSVVR